MEHTAGTRPYSSGSASSCLQPLKDSISPQRLKAAVHYTVGCLCEEVALDKQVQFSKQTIAAISEVTFRQCGMRPLPFSVGFAQGPVRVGAVACLTPHTTPSHSLPDHGCSDLGVVWEGLLGCPVCQHQALAPCLNCRGGWNIGHFSISVLCDSVLSLVCVTAEPVVLAPA